VRYWWVNQNQTFRQEIGGGYLWSPKRNANGARNPFYESIWRSLANDHTWSPTTLLLRFPRTLLKQPIGTGARRNELGLRPSGASEGYMQKGGVLLGMLSWPISSLISPARTKPRPMRQARLFGH